MPTRSAIVLAAAVALTACGNDEPATSAPNTALPPAETVIAADRADGAIALGQLVDTGYGVRAGVMSVAVGGDDGGPWLAADVRVEGIDEGGTVPNMGIVCGGAPELGGWQADSTIQMGAEVPAGTFNGGVVHLLLPGDGRYGEPIPECVGPAFIEIDAVEPALVEIPPAVLDELVAASSAFNG